jgi:hypothetical protein
MPKLPLPDEQPVAVNALRNKRAAIAGEIEMHSREIDRLRAELVHLDATMRLFDPDTNPEDIFGKRRFPTCTEYFARGEITRMIYDALRDRETVTAKELAELALTEKAIPETDRKTRGDFVRRFHNVLHDLRRRKHLQRIGGARVCAGGSRRKSRICYSAYIASLGLGARERT